MFPFEARLGPILSKFGFQPVNRDHPRPTPLQFNRPTFMLAPVPTTPSRFVPALLALTVSALAQTLPPTTDRTTPAELAALEADRSKAAPVAVPPASTASEQAVVLSPFEVVADNRGYQALNSMSGTRLNTKLEDLGASIEVVTKEQMADFAMLDINDVFLYAGNTEGTGTFSDYSETNTATGSTDDMTMQDPNNANRVRGLSSANVAVSGFEVSNRVRLDPLDTDGVEISRGPNANIFGVGSPGGTVNIIGASANLQRDRIQLQLRGDSLDGWRGSIDVNRVLLREKLALRATAAYQHDGFHLKPSGVDEKRLTGYVRYRPFQKTVLTASYQDVRTWGNRPNSISVIDAVSYWRSLGSPTYDPVTRTVHGGAQDGQVFPANNTVPAIAGTFIQNANYNQVFVDRDGIKYISPNFSVTGTTPTGGFRRENALLLSAPYRDTKQPLMPGYVQVSDRNVYDYTSINLSAMNAIRDETQTARVALEQNVLRSDWQSLDLQLGWLREDSERYGRWMVGSTSPSAGGNTGRLTVDVTERLLDGTPNPYFLRPYIASPEAQALRSPLRNDTYRGQFAYRLDFTRTAGWSRWLGAQNLVGYGEYKDATTFNFRYKDYLIAPWVPGIANPGNTNATINNAARTTHRFYLGDRGQNISYAPGPADYGDYPHAWGNTATGQFHYDTVTVGETASRSTTANFNGAHKIQKTGGILLQSHFLQSRLITTFGVRDDEIYTERTLHPGDVPQLFDPTGLYFNFAEVNGADIYERSWIRNAEGGRDWVVRKGRTETMGAVVKPFRSWAQIDRSAEGASGFSRVVARVLRGLSFHYNESDSFEPADPAVTITREILPDPRGNGKDYGFSLSLFDDKLFLRVNKYDNRTRYGRGGPSAGLAGILDRLDYNLFGEDLENASRTWLSAANPSWTNAQLDVEVEKVMGIPLYPTELSGYAITEADEKHSKGHEIELNYNPTRYWTVRASLAENVAIQATLSANLQRWVDLRMPTWTSVIDPRNTDNPATPKDERLWWYGTQVSPVGAPYDWYNQNFVTAYATSKSLEGLYRPQLSRYSGSLSTNFRLAGITEHSILKRFNVGGALRYVGKKTIGYYGKQELPAIITEIDVNRPIDLGDDVLADVFVAYRMRIWHNKIDATVQLNVRNLGDSARMIPTSAWPDGTRKTFRIAAPQQFILTTTFEL